MPGPVLRKLAGAGSYQQAAGSGVEAQAIGSVVAQARPRRVGPGGQQQVVFQLLGAAFVQHQVDAGPQLLVA
jgi:hypothetical protein